MQMPFKLASLSLTRTQADEGETESSINRAVRKLKRKATIPIGSARSCRSEIYICGEKDGEARLEKYTFPKPGGS